jgi:photosystem II stability/assembly factor-like uncharacterized protein
MKLFNGVVLGLLFFLVPQVGFSQEETQDTADRPSNPAKLSVDSGLLSSLQFRSIGPAMTSGRIGDIAINPDSPNTWYVGVGSGNLWKTTNAGTTFQPIFDNYGSYSIGCVTIDPNFTDTIWVGTGENNGGRHIGFGDGVYVSRNGGQSFTNMGLNDSEHISKIVVDPRNSNVIYVASQGPLWSGGGERGLFKSTDGGSTWKNILSKGEFTGVTDVVLDAKNPDVLYAATHQRQRTVAVLLNTGPESGIFKSTDGGENWRELTQGLPSGDKGKMALGISPQKNNVLYVSVETVNREGGFYRSENHGESWTRMSDFVSGGTGPHYYQEIYLDPHRFDVIYHANNTLVRSQDGGKTFVPVEGRYKHVDNHAVVFHPTDPNFVLVGCDGGVYRSNDYCATWQFFANLPVTQFYKVDVDYDTPFYHVVGGTQDNFTQYGPTATGNVQGIVNSDWQITIGGDGHDNAIDPEDPNTIYCESQEGYIQRYDRKTGESISIQPQPAAGEDSFRFNWDSPILISPHDHKRIYFGSRKLHRSDNRGDSWTTISDDLSRQIDRWTQPVMGRVWGIDAGFDLYAMSQYGNITSISESPIEEGLIYVGTDDGLVQITEDGGETWRKVDRFFDVPEFAFVNDIKADRHDVNTVYVCLDNHKTGDYKPYLMKSTDRGRTWKSIASDLPERHLVWRLEQDHDVADLLFLGTEFGAFTSVNGGENWLKLSAGMPTIPVRDLAIQRRENDLVAATFGRSFYVLDDYSPLRTLAQQDVDSAAHLFPIRNAWWYSPNDKLGGQKGYQGDAYFNSANPAFGTTFTVYLKDKIESLAAERKKAESEAKSSSENAAITSIEALRTESEEVLAQRFIDITTEEGTPVATVDLPNSDGLHRVQWDFRMHPIGGTGLSPMAGPGTYLATVCIRKKAKTEKLTEPVSFQVMQMIEPTLPAADQSEILEFQTAVNQVQFKLRQATQDFSDAADAIEPAIDATLASSLAMPDELSQLYELRTQAAELKLTLFGDPLKSERYIEQPPTPGRRLSTALFGSFSSHGPTTTHREQFEIAQKEIEELMPRLSSFEEQFETLRDRLIESGILIAD